MVEGVSDKEGVNAEDSQGAKGMSIGVAKS